MAGYSQTPLIDKLGIKDGMKVAILGTTRARKASMLKDRKVEYAEHGLHFDVVMYFSKSFSELRVQMPTLRRMINDNGMIWICWPKKAAKLLCDFSENDIRRLAIETQLIDVKVIAVDETWSGLKLVIPVALRKTKA